MINTKTVIIERHKRMGRKDRRILRRTAKHKGLKRVYFTFKSVPIYSHQSYVSTKDHFFGHYLSSLYDERYGKLRKYTLPHSYGKCGNHAVRLLSLGHYFNTFSFWKMKD